VKQHQALIENAPSLAIGVGLALLAGRVSSVAAQEVSPGGTDVKTVKAQLVVSPEAGWPQWRGPARNGICRETGLAASWPEGGPALLWTVPGLGTGYSSPTISGGRIFITGDTGDALRVTALSLEGKALWQTTNGASWKGPYPGARSCGAYAAGRLFHMNAHGRVTCLDAADGRELWAVNVLERFEGRNLTWALSECLLVDRGRVFVTAGGRKALMAALDARNGATLWASEPLLLGPSADPTFARAAEPNGEADPASYASPILVEVEGRRVLIHCSQRHSFGVDAGTGRLLWTRPLVTRYQVIAATPTFCGDGVFVTAPDADGGRFYRFMLREGKLGIEDGWSSPLDTCHGCLVAVDGALYGSWYRDRKGYGCVDLATGKVRYDNKTFAKGSILWADGRLYCLSEDGEMRLIEPTATGFEVRGQFRLGQPKGRDAWAHPVVLDGRLYLRFEDQLSCRDIRGLAR
jgi:outer membrane protein assembly factor BamB